MAFSEFSLDGVETVRRYNVHLSFFHSIKYAHNPQVYNMTSILGIINFLKSSRFTPKYFLTI